MELELTGVKPKGRRKKQWKNDFEEDLREMNLRETDVVDRDGWRTAMKS